MLEFRPNYILIVIEFQYDSKEKKAVPNDIRRSFMGLDYAKPNIPKKINEIIDRENQTIYPIHFGLIKKPITIKLNNSETNDKKRNYIIRNTAVGVMIVYEYLGHFQELAKFLEIFDEYIKELIENKQERKHFSVCTDYKIIIGKDWEDVKR